MELIESDGNIRFVVKEFPILGEESVLASRFALGVREVEGDEAYSKVHDELMEFRGNITEDSLSDLSETLGYETKAVFDAMNGDAVKEIIRANRALGQRLSINGTPSFVFQDEMVRGYVPLDAMRQIVDEVRGES
jgi:protein-disulfide isomerase